MNDVLSRDDIKIFVDSFYQKVKIDQDLGPIFAARIAQNDWPKHLERMYGFWDTVLFGAKDYKGNPFSKHSTLRIEEKHFARWVSLLTTTIHNNFKGPKAEEVIKRAQMMGQLFQSKLAHLKNNPNYKNIV